MSYYPGMDEEEWNERIKKFGELKAEQQKGRMEFLQKLKEEIRSREYLIQKLIDPYVMKKSEHDDGGQWHHCGFEWHCPDSPYGLCAYHTIHDRAHDFCIFCGEPEERK